MSTGTGIDMAPGAELTWAEPAAEQFDFWCGVWHGETVAGGTSPPAAAHNEVSWLWNRGALLEDFSMPAGEGEFHGRSLSIPVAGRGWCQTWVDSDGQYLDFVGGLVGEEMILARTASHADGRQVRQRMRWWAITPNAFSWDWLSAGAGSVEWDLRWRLRYTRA